MEATIKITERYPPGDFFIWMFIYAELLVFGIFFLSYSFARSQDVALFNESQLSLNKTTGIINTLVLITSSYFVARAVAAIKENRTKLCANWLLAANVFGFIFLALKLSELIHKYNEGISLSTNTFYMFYLSMSFFHFMHVILGMVILFAVMFKARSGGYSDLDHNGVETGASYWHMVDLVWIILFPLVYIIR